jgi:signal transduction histidine kinase
MQQTAARARPEESLFMLPRPLLVLVAMALIALLGIGWIADRSTRTLADAARLTVDGTPRAEGLQVAHAERARRYARYGPWVMCAIAVILSASLLIQIAATLRHARQMREELERAAELAQEAQRMKDQFLATVSHELRNPLTAIVGWCRLLSEERSDPALLDEGLANIGQAASIQSQLIEDLLDVSRIIAGRIKLSLAEIDPAEVIDKAIASVIPSAQAKGIVIRKVVGGDRRPLLGDATRLEQVLWNLLSNAIKFTPGNGTIDVALRCTGSNAEITVTDDGVGIAADLLPYIFDRFRQGESTGTRQAGLGLGLSIVRNLVGLHGGSVRAESGGPGGGAKFTVQLPLAPAAGAAEAAGLSLKTEMQLAAC